MKTTLFLLALLALTLAAAEPAAATCMYREVVGVDPIKRDTGNPTLDGIYVSVGVVECHPPGGDPP